MEMYTMILTGMGIVATIAFVLLVYRLWSVLKEIELFMRETRGETTPILHKTDRTLERIDRISEMIENRAQQTDQDLESISENLKTLSHNIRVVSENWREDLKPDGRWSGWISTAVSSGYKIFQSLKKSPSKKGGKNHG